MTAPAVTGDSDPARPARSAVPSLPGRMGPRPLLAIEATALGARVLYMTLVIPSYVPAADARQYRRLAAAVARGSGLSFVFPFWFHHPTAFRPPLYPALLGSIWRVTGDSNRVGQGLNILLGCVVVLLVAVLAARIAGPTAGLVAGLIAAVYPPLLANDTTLLTEPLSLVLLLGAVLLIVDGRVEWAGVVSGLLVLARPSAQILAVAVAVWIIWRVGWAAALRYLLLTVLVVSPWIARNWLLLGTPRVVTSNGFTLAAVYSPEAERLGRFTDPVFESGFDDLSFEEYDEADWGRALQRLAIDNLRRNPAQIIGVVGVNLGEWFELGPGRNTIPEILDGRNLDFRRATIWAFYLVTVAGMLGLIATRRSRAAELLAVFAGYFFVASMLTVAPPRVRAPFDVIMCIAAGAGIGFLVERRTRRPGAVRPSGTHRRAWRTRTFTVVVMTGFVFVAAGTPIARAWLARDARESVLQSLERGEAAASRIVAQYPLSVSRAGEPSRFDVGAPLDRLRRTEGDLWRASAYAAPDIREPIR